MANNKLPSEEFNTIQFEKKLTSLKDSQEHINVCCKWCLENKHNHKKIVTSWLNVFKRVKIEQRLILFYLANDVIQYSKRRNYEFVDSWATALQKATTLVRDDKVKHKIVRIFNIWEQRGVYNEEFISDLCGLISAVPTAAKNDEPHEFQAQYVINKIKHCAKLENDTDVKQRILKEHNPKIQPETETLCGSLKDRAHVDDVEKEIENYVKHLENYINALKSEIKARITNISVLKQANTQLEKDKRDVKVVANAYRTFGTRIKAFQKKLDEHKETLASPVPSPDINAPSPSPDSDLDLPDDNEKKPNNEIPPYNPAITFSAGYYNPVPPPVTDSNPNFTTNGYTSFIGSAFSLGGLGALPTNTETTTGSSLTTEVTNSSLSSVLQSISAPPPPPDTPANTSNFQFQNAPLLPPPMPPFSSSEDYSSTTYNKPSYENGRGRGADIDHRNLISLTGSPADSNSNPPIPAAWPPQTDQDYRSKTSTPVIDQDYRLPPPPFTMEQLKLPPPPPPPTKPAPPLPSNSLGKKVDDVQSIDMDLSEDEMDNSEVFSTQFVVKPDKSRKNTIMKPPPPLPELPDDDDANNFLDDLSNDLNSHEFTANLTDMSQVQVHPTLTDNSGGVYNKMGMKGPMLQFSPGMGNIPQMMTSPMSMDNVRSHNMLMKPGNFPHGNMNIPHGNMNMQQHANINMPHGNFNAMQGNMNMTQGNMNMLQGNINLQSGMSQGNMNMPHGNMGMPLGDPNMPPDGFDMPPDGFDMPPEDFEADDMDMSDNDMNNSYNDMGMYNDFNDMNNMSSNDMHMPPHNNWTPRSRPFPFRGRGRGNFMNNRGAFRGRGRGFRGPNNFRPRGFGRGGGRPPRSRGNRGNFQGGY